MTVTIGDITFDHVEYDADANVLYLHVGDPARAVDFDETAKGHADRTLCGVVDEASIGRHRKRPIGLDA